MSHAPKPPSPRGSKKDWPAAPFTGARWGAIAGFLIGNLYVNSNKISTFGVAVYPGDAGVVLIESSLAGAALGAFIGWLVATGPASNDDAPPTS